MITDKKSMFNRPVSEMIAENAVNNAGMKSVDDKSIYDIPESMTDAELTTEIDKLTPSK